MAACSSDPVSPQHGSRLQPPFSGRFSLAAASRVTAYAGDGSLVHRVRCDADLQRLVVRRALLLAALRPGSRPSRRSTRAVRNLGEAPDPTLYKPFRRGMCSCGPQCTDSIALSCPSGLRWRRSGLEAPGIAARAGGVLGLLCGCFVSHLKANAPSVQGRLHIGRHLRHQGASRRSRLRCSMSHTVARSPIIARSPNGWFIAQPRRAGPPRSPSG